MAELKPMLESDIENIVSDAVENAVSFVESEIMQDRIKAQRYFDGETDIGFEDGRSKVVSTKVRDTVRNIKPSLLRIFASNDKAVEFVPKKPQDVPLAETATAYVNWAFNESGGFNLLTDAFHDALVKKQGVLKAYWDEYTTGEIHTYDNLTDEEYYLIAMDSEIEILEHSEEIIAEVDEMGLEIERKEHALKIIRKSTEGKLCVKSVPPEEFFVDRNATCVEDSYCIAHRSEMRVGDVVAMGFDFEEIAELDGMDGDLESEVFERQGYNDDDADQQSQDLSMKLVQITEAYMRMDIEGTGAPMLYKFTLGGTNYKLLDYELWDEIPFAVFEVDPEPHSFYGRSIADLVINDQDAATSMLRGILDNVALANNPRLEVADDLVNIDDLLNNEIGAIVRVKQNGAVQPMAVPFIAGSTLPALQYLDMLSETKTGVSRASLGLDPDSLQNTSATAAKLASQGGQGQIEVIARNLAESGLKRLFKLCLKLLIKNTPEETLMRVNGQFVPVDPRVWDSAMDVTVNVGLGTGQEDMKLATLNQTLQMQMQIFAQYGMSNGLVSITSIRNTLADMLALGGYHNAERYFNPMNPQIEQQLMQQMMQQQQGAQDPNSAQAQAIVQAEQIKAQAKMQSDAARLQAQQQTDAARIQAQQQAKMAELTYRRQGELEKLKASYESDLRDNDLARDKMAQDMMIEQARIAGQHGTALDIERIRAMQSAPRDENGNI